MENFKSLQLTAGQTGVSLNKLTSAFGESMDEFGGSARKAGSLNAILGRSVFNSIDLLGKTEAQRVETIVKGIKESVDVKALGRNKFQLKAVADGLGLTPDETRRLLSGQMSVDEALAGKESADPRIRANAKMADLLEKRTNPALAQFEYTIRRTRKAMDNVSASANKVQRDLIRNLGESLIRSGQLDGILPSARPSEVAKTLDNMLNQLTVQQVEKIATDTNIGKTAAEIKRGGIFDVEVLKKEGGEAFKRFFTAVKEQAGVAAQTPGGVVDDATAEKFGRMDLPQETKTAFSRALEDGDISKAIAALTAGAEKFKQIMEDFALGQKVKR